MTGLNGRFERATLPLSDEQYQRVSNARFRIRFGFSPTQVTLPPLSFFHILHNQTWKKQKEMKQDALGKINRAKGNIGEDRRKYIREKEICEKRKVYVIFFENM